MASRADSQVSQLSTLVADLGPIKEQLSSLKKKESKLVDAVKNIMINSGLDKVEAGGYVASIAEIQNDVLNEKDAMAILKHELANQPELLADLIKVREYLDNDALETAVYNHKLPEGILETAIEHRAPTIRLTCSKDKGGF